MRFSAAFRETMFRFNLKGAEIADRSGLTKAQISQFRRSGQNIRVDNLERLLAALPEEARGYLLTLVMQDPLAESDLPSEPSCQPKDE